MPGGVALAMPHIELRVSPNIVDQVDCRALLGHLVARLAEFETVNPAAIKGYQVTIPTYEMGEGAPNGFIHVTASILSGRPVELRCEMGQALHAIVNQEADMHAAGASVEIREMDKETYFK